MPSKSLGNLDFDTASLLLTAASDVALVVTPGRNGLIRDVAFGSDELAVELEKSLRGKPWVTTVTVESRPKIEALISDAEAKVPPKWRQVNHPSKEGIDLPVMYAAVQIGSDGRIVAVGRSMRPMAKLQQQLVEAQQSMDRELLRLRQAETRHRLLFQLSSEAVLIVDASSQKVVDANPIAIRMLGDSAKRLMSRTISDVFDAASRPAIVSLLGAVTATGRGQDVPARFASDRTRDVFVSASLFREGRSTYFLMRLVPMQQGAEALSPSSTRSKVIEVVESSPDGFVVTDPSGAVLYANRTFLDSIQLASVEQVRGQPISRWLGRPGIDSDLLNAQLREHGSVRRFSTVLRGEFGAETEVEICGVAVPDGEEPCQGYSIRETEQRRPAAVARAKGAERPRTVEQLTELVGRVPLKELVRESTDMIERLCIEAALQITGDNRASAAEMLGLSRQSLYAKLRRYDLGDLGSDESEGTED